MLSFGVLTVFFVASLLIASYYDVICDDAEFQEKLRTFEPSVYYEKVERGEGLGTTFTPDELASIIRKDVATINEQYIQKCLNQYQIKGRHFESRYMSAKYMNTHPQYRSIREEHFQRAFEESDPSIRDVHRDEDWYKEKFNKRYGEELKSSNLDGYWRYCLFVRWLLKTDEWRSLNSPAVDELTKFYDAMLKHTTTMDAKANDDEVAHAFGNSWTWLRNFLSAAGNESPVRLAASEAEMAKQFIRVLDDLEENVQIRNFCRRVFADILEKIAKPT